MRSRQPQFMLRYRWHDRSRKPTTLTLDAPLEAIYEKALTIKRVAQAARAEGTNTKTFPDYIELMTTAGNVRRTIHIFPRPRKEDR